MFGYYILRLYLTVRAWPLVTPHVSALPEHEKNVLELRDQSYRMRLLTILMEQYDFARSQDPDLLDFLSWSQFTQSCCSLLV